MTDEEKAAGRARQVDMMAGVLRTAYFASNASSADGRFREVAVVVCDLVEQLVEAAILARPEEDEGVDP